MSWGRTGKLRLRREGGKIVGELETKNSGAEETMTKLPPVRIPHPHIVIDETVHDGSPLIEGSGGATGGRGASIPVRRLFLWYRQGTTVEVLLRRFPGLGHARVFDALAFAYDNIELIEADILRERENLKE